MCVTDNGNSPIVLLAIQVVHMMQEYSKTHLLLNFSKIQNIISSTTRILLEMELTRFMLT